MSISLAHLAERLASVPLLPTALEEWRAEHVDGDARAFVEEQVADGKLTLYQAEALLDPQSPPLALGNYVILDRIGSGGMGQVFKAKHRRMKRLAAIKILADDLTNSPEAIDRFHQEVEAAARLSHPNIVITHDADECDGLHYLVMEYVAGHDLASVVEAEGSLEVPLAVECILQAARGLEYAHGKGIVHRDIKPGNLLLTGMAGSQTAVHDKPIVKILDMGLARLSKHRPSFGDSLDDVPALTATGQIMGTIDYMSPEQAEDAHAVDHRADIYSLGCTLYRLLAGRPLFGGTTAMKKLLAHREADIPSLCAVRSDVPAELEAAYRKMVAKTPDDRFQTMTELIGALLTCQQKLEDPVAQATLAHVVDAELTTTDAVERTAKLNVSPAQTPSASETHAARSSTADNVETVAYPRGQATSDTAPPSAATAPLRVSPDSNTAALLGFGAGVVALILSLLTGWIPCAGIAIVVLPVGMAILLGGIGRAKSAQGSGHGRKALIGMGLGFLAIVSTIALQFVGGSRFVNWVIESGKAQFQREQQWWSLSSVWQAPPANASTDQLLPPKVNRFVRKSVDNKTSLPRLNIDLSGQHAVYESDNQTQEVYVWQASELEKEAIFSRIDDAIRDNEDDTGPSNLSMSYGSPPTQKYRWVIDLPEGNQQVALWWGGDWLFLSISTDDSDGFLRTLLLEQMSGEANDKPE